jgi:hypothetical protein
MLRVLPPGAAPDDPEVFRLPPGVRFCGVDAAGGVIWLRRDAVGETDEVHRSDVVAGTEAIVGRLPRSDENAPVPAVAGDGTFYHAVAETRVRRLLITNFGDRPR